MRSSHTYPFYYRAFAKIDLDAIAHNLRELQSCLSRGVKTMAVVKADGYGHGSVQVARHLEENVDYFAVAGLDEAVILREGGIQKPILVLSYTSPFHYDTLLSQDITATLYNPEEAKALSDAALKKGKKAKIHVAVDTGMGRIGFTPSPESADTVQAISCLPGIMLEGLFSHYACADCADKADALCQTSLFDSFIALLEERNVHIPLKHICNSAGTMDFTKQYDMCRLGIALYGLYPSDEMDTDRIVLRPAMEVVCHVVHIKTVPGGFKIGYGHIYTAPRERKIATLSIGYADGYNRCLTDAGYVLINGKKASVVGKVCMDQIMVDITDIPDVSVGDHAIVLGENEGACISAETLGSLCHSFNYEVVCNFMPRVHRIYYKDGVPVEPI
ncbi:MAG: alanine racemase [Ruminococcaceae bacterium]|nr:alanine racemase [Oscillospiraceae bacterium]